MLTLFTLFDCSLNMLEQHRHCELIRLHLSDRIAKDGWPMVKSETRRDAEILVRNPSPRLFGKKFRDSKKVKTNHAKTRLRDLSKTLLRFRDPAKIFRDRRFSWHHSPPLQRPTAVHLEFHIAIFWSQETERITDHKQRKRVESKD